MALRRLRTYVPDLRNGSPTPPDMRSGPPEWLSDTVGHAFRICGMALSHDYFIWNGMNTERFKSETSPLKSVCLSSVCASPNR